MNKNSLLLLALLVAYGCGNKGGTNQYASLQIDHIEEYCGGAAPPEELLQELDRPKPLSDTLYLHPDYDAMRDGDGVVVVLKDGKADLTGLPKGCYVVFRSAKMYKDSVIGDPIIHDCLYMESNAPSFDFNYYMDNQLITDTIMTTCSPCYPPMP